MHTCHYSIGVRVTTLELPACLDTDSTTEQFNKANDRTWNDLGGFFVSVNCPADRMSVRASDKEEKSHCVLHLGTTSTICYRSYNNL